MTDGLIVVTGAGGFIGGCLVGRLLSQGCDVRAVDVKPFSNWCQLHMGAENRSLDLRVVHSCRLALEDAAQVYDLACEMGGPPFIESNEAQCVLSALVHVQLLAVAREVGVARYFFASSACVSAAEKQTLHDRARPGDN